MTPATADWSKPLPMSQGWPFSFARPWMSRLENTTAAVLSYLLVLLVTLVVAEMAYWLMIGTRIFPSFNASSHAVFLLRTLTISTVVAAIVLRYLYVQFQWRQQIQAESRARLHVAVARSILCGSGRPRGPALLSIPLDGSAPNPLSS